MKKLIKTIIALMLTANAAWAADNTQKTIVTSPDGKLKVCAESGNGLKWSVNYNGTAVIEPSAVGITIGGKEVITGKASMSKVKYVDKTYSVFYAKRKEIKDIYNTVTLSFKSGAKVELRFPSDCEAFVPYVNDNRGGERWCYSFESYYDEQCLSQMFRDSLAIPPLAVTVPTVGRAVVMDAGVENYPGMMLVKGDGNSLKAQFAPYPTESEIGGYARLNLVPTKRADYIARINKGQALPWRVVVVAKEDREIMNSDVAQLLAPECRIADTSWIKPGKVAWDWWNNTNITGVDFKSGMNTPTYKYYIDFAQKNKLEYIIIDEGWSNPEDLYNLNDDINLDELIDYANKHQVGIILWSSWRNLTQQGSQKMEEIMKHYAEKGIKGFKVDFFDRDDQKIIQSAYDIADCAARNHLLLDLHGLKPFGIQMAYPNILNFEAVKGLENSKWEPRNSNGPIHDQPQYDCEIPYLRMLLGPMDYTPGAMTNATRSQFFGNNDHPMSQGTRTHQIAMYTVFYAPLQMLADSPTKYMQNQECTDFIAKVPTTWD